MVHKPTALRRKLETEPQLDTWKSKRSIQHPIDPKVCVDSESEVQNVAAPRNRDLETF